MPKLLSFVFALLFTGPLVSACSQGALTPEGRAINDASKVLVKSFGNVTGNFCEQPRALRVRVNPCHCSDELKYDVHLGGNWRRVAIKGQETALNDFEQRAKQAGDKIFEADFILLHVPFRTPQNQDIYWLEVFNRKPSN